MICNFNITLSNFISNINNLLWGSGVFILIVCIGIYFTIRIKLFNIIHIVHIFKSVFSIPKQNTIDVKKGKISHFQALSTTLAASMGTGNIIGVAAAISMGGPGAIFWMWVSGIFGTAIGLIENTLGHLYKSRGNGPMGYISCAFRSKYAALIYALLCAAASFGIGNITQSNAIASAASEFHISAPVSGTIVAIIVAFIIFRGCKKVVAAAERLVPFVAIFYLLGALFVIVLYGNSISNILTEIINSAFGFNQITGGISAAFLKKTIAVGLRRGIFSNEAGLGSSVLIHSEVSTNSSVQMGMFSVVEVIIDTILCCTATAFVILLTNTHASDAEGLAMITAAFRSVMGDFSSFFVSSTTIIFAFCTIIGWYFYGEKCIEFVFKNGNSKAVFAYRILYIFSAYAGAVARLQLVWEIADLLNWFMLVINLAAVIILHNDAVKEINNYTNCIKASVKYK